MRRRGKPPKQKNITTYNLARMNMLLHGVKDTEFDIFHGDTLLNEWDMMREQNPAKKPSFDAIVANPPFSYASLFPPLFHRTPNFDLA